MAIESENTNGETVRLLTELQNLVMRERPKWTEGKSIVERSRLAQVICGLTGVLGGILAGEPVGLPDLKESKCEIPHELNGLAARIQSHLQRTYGSDNQPLSA